MSTPKQTSQIYTLKTSHTLYLFSIIVLWVLSSYAISFLNKKIAFFNPPTTIAEDSRRPVINQMYSEQTLIGPFLVVPYIENFTSVDTVTDKNGESQVVTRNIHNQYTAILLPDKLEIRTDLEIPETANAHSGSDQENIMYTAQIGINGFFNHDILLESEEVERRILWEKASINLGVTENSSLLTVDELQLGNRFLTLQPGSGANQLLKQGLHVFLKAEDGDSEDAQLDFKLDLSLQGKNSFFITPMGIETEISFSGNWPHIQLQGIPDYPTPEPKINDQGFSANWVVPHINRSYPQYSLIDERHPKNLSHFTSGIRLFPPPITDSRFNTIIHYAPFITGLIFMLLLALSPATERLHPMQYLVVAIILALFYLKLWILSSQWPFTMAYWAAAGSNALLIAFYTSLVLSRLWKGLITGGFVLALCFMVLQSSLQPQYIPYSQLACIILATLLLMYATRHWQSNS